MVELQPYQWYVVVQGGGWIGPPREEGPDPGRRVLAVTRRGTRVAEEPDVAGCDAEGEIHGTRIARSQPALDPADRRDADGPCPGECALGRPGRRSNEL